MIRTTNAVRCILALAGLSLHLLVAQPSASDSSKPFNPISRGLKDLWIQAQAPFAVSAEHAPWAVAGAAVFGGLLLADQSIHDAIDPPKWEGTSAGHVSQTVTGFGALYGLGFLAGFTSYGFLAGDEKAKETSYLAAEAFVTAGFWTQTLKLLSGRERPPDRTQAGGKWTGPFAVSFSRHFSHFDSFPSGHTSTAFSIATVFAEQYAETPGVPLLSYTLASLVGISRITVNRHWASDVFAGAVIGYLCAREVLANNPSEVSRREDQSETRWMIIPHEREYGLSVIIRF